MHGCMGGCGIWGSTSQRFNAGETGTLAGYQGELLSHSADRYCTGLGLECVAIEPCIRFVFSWAEHEHARNIQAADAMTALRGHSLSDPLALIAFGRLRESSWYWEGRQLVVRLEPGTTVEQFASAVCNQIELLALERVDCMNRIVASIRHRVLNISKLEIRDQLEQVFAQMDRDSPLLTAWHSPVQLLMLPMPYHSKPDTVNVVYRDGVSVPDTDSWCVDSDSDVLACDTNVLRMPFPRYSSKHAAVMLVFAGCR